MRIGSGQTCIRYSWSTALSSFLCSLLQVPSYCEKLAAACLGHEMGGWWEDCNGRDVMWPADKYYMAQMLEGLPAIEPGLAKLLMSTRISCLWCYVEIIVLLYSSLQFLTQMGPSSFTRTRAECCGLSLCTAILLELDGWRCMALAVCRHGTVAIQTALHTGSYGSSEVGSVENCYAMLSWEWGIFKTFLCSLQNIFFSE